MKTTIKLCMVSVCCLLFGSCSASQSVNSSTLTDKVTVKKSSEVDTELEQALMKNDFRLYATAGRRVVFPGIANQDIGFVIETCGRKFIAHTGDTLTSDQSDQQRLLRNHQIAYAQAYNQHMIKHCRQHYQR